MLFRSQIVEMTTYEDYITAIDTGDYSLWLDCVKDYTRLEESRVGKEWLSTSNSRASQCNKKTRQIKLQLHQCAKT